MTSRSVRRLGVAVVAGIGASLLVANAASARETNCTNEHDLHSERSDTKAVLTFVNKDTDVNDYVTIYWLDYKGKRVKYKSLRGKQIWTVSTYYTHPWLIATPNWEANMLCHQIFVPDQPVAVVTVGGYPEE